MTSYVALLWKDEKSDYGVMFPDFPGCVTAGTTLDEAKDLAMQALAFHVEGIRADGETVPEPSGLEAIMADAANRDAVAFLVEVPPAREKAVRLQVTMQPSVVAEIDARTAASNTSRSIFSRAGRAREDRARKKIGEGGLTGESLSPGLADTVKLR